MDQQPKGWTRIYWDIFDHLYWVPDYLGLKSIPQSTWTRQGNKVCVPLERTNSSGPLYYREKSRSAALDRAKRLEEPFNHLLDLTLSLLSPDDLPKFLTPLCDLPKIESLSFAGRELSDDLGWHENTTTPDVFARGSNEVVMVEIKFGAKTNMDQLVKYMAVIVRDAQVHGPKDFASLTYVLPGADSLVQVEKAIGMSLSHFREMDIDALCEDRNEAIKEVLLRDRDQTRRVLETTRIHAVSWEHMHSVCLAQADVDAENIYGRTYRNLMLGLAEAVEIHPLSKVT